GFVSGVNRVSGHRDRAGIDKVHVCFIVAAQVADDGPKPNAFHLRRSVADHANVRTADAVTGLNRVRGSGAYAHRALAAIDPDFGRGMVLLGGRVVFGVVIFDVVPGDFDVANAAVGDANSAAAVI